MSSTSGPQSFTREEVDTWPSQKRYQYILEHFNRILYAYASKMGVDSEIVSIQYGCLLVGSTANDVDEKLALMDRLIGYSNRITFFASLIVRRARPEQCCLEERFWKLTNNGESYPCCMAPRSVDYGVLLYHTCRMLQCLCYDKNIDVRTQALRTIRYQCMTVDGIFAFLGLGLDIVITMSVLYDNRHMSVRVQALKLLRHVLDLYPNSMTRSMGAAVACIAESGRDEFRRIALDTLRALSLARPVLFASLGCLNVIYDAALDPTLQDLTQVCVLLVLSFLDHPQTRVLVDPFPLISRSLGAFTDLTSTLTPQRDAILLQHILVTVNTLHSYPGQVLLASHATGLRSLATILTFACTPSTQPIQKSILSLLTKIICKINSQDILTIRKHLEFTPVTAHNQCINLLVLYVAQVLRVLLRHGFIDALATLIHQENSPPETSEQLAEILKLAVCILPRSDLCRKLGLNTDTRPYHSTQYSANLANQRMIEDVLAQITIFFTPTKDSIISHSAVRSNYVIANSLRMSREQNIPSWCAYNINFGALLHLTDTQYHVPFQPWVTAERPEATNIELISLKNSQHSHMSDLALQGLMRKTGVLLSKDVTTWDWDALQQYVEGPLQHAGPFHATVKTKLCKRILSYTRPEKKGFALLSLGVSHTIVRRVVLATVRAHQHTQEGRMSAFLLDLYHDITAHLNAEIGHAASILQKQSTAYILQYQLDQEVQKINVINDTHIKSNIFTKNALSNTCSGDLVGILISISTARGVSIDTSKFWESLASLATYISHDYQARVILTHLDFQNSAEARVLLHHWCVTGSTFLRRYIATMLYILARTHTSNLTLWAVDVQIALLHAPDTQVTLIALAALEVMCSSDIGCLTLFIARCPKLDHFGNLAYGLHMQLLTSTEGTEWLLRKGWLTHQLQIYKAQSHHSNDTQDVVNLALANCFSEKTSINACVTNDYAAVQTSNPCYYESPHLPPYSNYLLMGCSNFIASPTSHDGYLLQQQLKTPWSVELVLETAQGRIAPILTDVYLSAGVGDAGVPLQKLGTQKEDQYVVGEDEVSPAHMANVNKVKYFAGETPGTPALYIVANIVDTNNHPSGFLIDHAATLHTRVRSGALCPGTPSLAISIGNRKKTVSPDVPGNWLKNPADVSSDAADVMKLSDTQTSRSLPMQRRVLYRSQHTSDHMQTQYSEENTNQHGMNWSEEETNTTTSNTGIPNNIPKCTVPIYSNNTFYSLDGSVRWNYTETKEGLLLTSIWFRIPPSEDTVPGTRAPTHQFTYLPHTARGVELIEESGILETYHDILSQALQGNGDLVGCVVRKTLSAVGELAKTPRGFQLLVNAEIVKILLALAVGAQVLTLRGCVMNTLSCVASTDIGGRYLYAHGWDVVSHKEPFSVQCLAVPTQSDPYKCDGLNAHKYLHEHNDTTTKSADAYATHGCWPLDPMNVVSVKNVPTVGLNSVTVEFPQSDKLLKQVHTTLGECNNNISDEQWESLEVKECVQHILGLISNLSNSVGQKSTLVRLKAQKQSVPLFFKNVRIFSKVYELLCAHTMKLGARRYILTELFEFEPDIKDIDYLARYASEYKYEAL